MKKICTRNRLLFTLVFCFFFVLLTLSPISGDDWGNYLVGKVGIKHCFGQAVGMYFSWEGRFISRILINLLTYHKWLWNIINSICITGIIYQINTITNKKNKVVPLCLSILTILLMNVFTFSQVIVWIAGNITYLFPLFLILIYIIVLKNCKSNLTNTKRIILTILNLSIPMFVEHMAVLLIVINLIKLLTNYYETKKWNREWIMYTLISIFSTLLMFLSPGTRLRSGQENLAFNELNIFHKVFFNIPNFIYYTFIINGFMLVLLTISNIINVKKMKLKTKNEIGLILYLSLIPILTVIIYNISIFLNIPNLFLEIINQNNILIQFYWLSYLVLYLYLLFKNAKTKKGKHHLLITLLGFLANIIMLMSPTWGYRTSLLTYILLVIPPIESISNIKLNKYLEKIIIFITILTSIFWLVFYISIRIEQENIEKTIKTGIKEEKQVIEIPSFPSYANCNINPENDFHLKQFKKYYGIKEETTVKLLPNNWRFIIIK